MIIVSRYSFWPWTYPEGRLGGGIGPPPPEKYENLEGVQLDQVSPAGKQFFYMVIPPKKILGTSLLWTFRFWIVLFFSTYSFIIFSIWCILFICGHLDTPTISEWLYYQTGLPRFPLNDVQLSRVPIPSECRQYLKVKFIHCSFKFKNIQIKKIYWFISQTPDEQLENYLKNMNISRRSHSCSYNNKLKVCVVFDKNITNLFIPFYC